MSQDILHKLRAIVTTDDLGQSSPESIDFLQMLPHAVACTRWLDEHKVAVYVHNDEGVLFAATDKCLLPRCLKLFTM